MKDMLPPYLKEQGRVEMLEEADWFGWLVLVCINFNSSGF